MFMLFSDQGRAAVCAARHEARMSDHDFIGPEHLLLALFSGNPRLRGNSAVRILVRLGVSRAEVYDAISRVLQPGTYDNSKYLHLSPAIKEVFREALKSAGALGDCQPPRITNTLSQTFCNSLALSWAA